VILARQRAEHKRVVLLRDDDITDLVAEGEGVEPGEPRVHTAPPLNLIGLARRVEGEVARRVGIEERDLTDAGERKESEKGGRG
jgi:hypothetical protein